MIFFQHKKNAGILTLTEKGVIFFPLKMHLKHFLLINVKTVFVEMLALGAVHLVSIKQGEAKD